jgi:hypothetical protein
MHFIQKYVFNSIETIIIIIIIIITYVLLI